MSSPNFNIPTNAPREVGVPGVLSASAGNLIPVANILHYAKTYAYVIVTLVGVLILGLNSHEALWPLAVNLIIAGAGAVVVYVVPNVGTSVGGYLKLIMGALVAVAQVLVPFASFHAVTPIDWLSAAVAGFAAFGVYVTPNGPAQTYQLAA